MTVVTSSFPSPAPRQSQYSSSSEPGDNGKWTVGPHEGIRQPPPHCRQDPCTLAQGRAKERTAVPPNDSTACSVAPAPPAASLCFSCGEDPVAQSLTLCTITPLWLAVPLQSPGAGLTHQWLQRNCLLPNSLVHSMRASGGVHGSLTGGAPPTGGARGSVTHVYPSATRILHHPFPLGAHKGRLQGEHWGSGLCAARGCEGSLG